MTPTPIPLHTGLAGFFARLAIHWRHRARWEGAMRTRYGSNWGNPLESIETQDRLRRWERDCWDTVRDTVRESGGGR